MTDKIFNRISGSTVIDRLFHTQAPEKDILVLNMSILGTGKLKC